MVTTDTSTIKIAVASGPDAFDNNNTTRVAAVDGVATFSNLIIDTAGTYTLQVTDGSLDRGHLGQHHDRSGRREPIGL